jgi:hypothetical protein
MKTSAKSPKQSFGNYTGIIGLTLLFAGLAACEKEAELNPSNNDLTETSQKATYYDDKSGGVMYPGTDYYSSPDPSGDVKRSGIESPETWPNIQEPIGPHFFNVIKIDHYGARSRLPDYSVTVRSDGLVIYEGRNHVRVRDRVTFYMSGITLPVLNEIFVEGRFYNITSDVVISADRPYVLTTYQPSVARRPKSIADNYKDYPAQLIQIRSEVENLLGIGRFVYNDFPALPASLSPSAF